MSLGLIDFNTIYQIPNFNEGQISIPFCDCSKEVSGFVSKDQIGGVFEMNSYGQSGFVNSSEVNPNFESSTSGGSNLGPERPTFSSISSRSRPRMVKLRKSGNPRSMGSSGTRKIDPGFNPFRPESGNLAGDDASLDMSKHLNLKVTNKIEKAGNALVDEIRKLRIQNHQTGSNIATQSAHHDSNEREGTSVSASASGIPRSRDGVGGDGLPPELPDGLKSLNLGGGLRGEGSKFDECNNIGRNCVANIGFSGGGRNVGGLFGSTLASELPNDLNKLNIKDSNEVGSQNFVFGSCSSSSRGDFVFGRSSSRKNDDTVAPEIAGILHDKIKNLNIKDSDQSEKEMNGNKSTGTFESGDSGTSTGNDGIVDPMILDEIEKLKIGDCSESTDVAGLGNSSSVRKESERTTSMEDNGILNNTGFTSLIGEKGKNSSGPQVADDQSKKGSDLHQTCAPSMSSFPSTGFHSQSVRVEFQGACTGGADQKTDFPFSWKHDGLRVPPVEFRTPDPKGSLFTGSNQKKASVKDSISRGRKGKLKEPTSVLMSIEKSVAPQETSFRSYSEPFEYASPMDISPYRETNDDKQSAKEPPFTSDYQTLTGTNVAFSNDATNEELVAATECLDINKDNDVKHDEAEVQVSECSVSVSAVETESFKSASENLDRSEENEVDSNSEAQSCDQTQYFSASSSLSSEGSAFTFAASSSAQSQASTSMRHNRRKTRMKAGPEIYIPTRSATLSDATSSLQYSPMSRVSVLPSLQQDVLSTVSQNGGTSLKVTSPSSKAIGGNDIKDTKREIASSASASRSAQEACERWRLRGNQAYSNGDLDKADDYYTQGLSCIPQNETSRDCLRALVLCYSNRAATRMSLGRMREALQDCLVAAEIDPNFFRVQLRAANCYLALGEVGDASRYFQKLLQSTDVCVERKLILEASDGMQKTQKVSECMENSRELLLRRTLTDAESALGVIAQALVISPFSEQLLERKAAALLMLRKYDDVIQLCQHTLEGAEKNFQLSSAEPELLKSCPFCIWRYSFIFKANFCLGKLEEGLEFLEKQERWRSMVNKYGNEALESLIPQLSIARELIRHKCAGNEAFQARRHTEAVEHYTSALSFNVESRPFAAVCFCNRAAAYQALGQITDAIADCSLAIALDGNYLKAISRRATLFEMIRDYDQAAKDLERLVSLLTKQAEEKTNQSGSSLPMSSLSDLRQARQRLYQMEEQSKRDIPLNFYLIFGVEPSVTAADLKKAYRKAALRHHPDKAGQSLARSESGDDGIWKEIAEEVYKDADRLFKMIGEAYAVLSDPNKRSQYDIEEETRNGVKKTARMHTDSPFNTAERATGRQWRDVGRSSANPYYRGFEPTRPSRYY